MEMDKTAPVSAQSSNTSTTQSSTPMIILVAVITLLLGGIGGYILGINKTQTAPTQVVIPTSNKPQNSDISQTTNQPSPDTTEDWMTVPLNFGDISLLIKLPPQIVNLGNLNRVLSNGEKGTQICWNPPIKTSLFVKPVIAGGGSCDWGTFSIGSISKDYEAGRSSGFSDTKGYIKSGSDYQYKGMLKNFSIPTGLASEITNPYGIKVLKVTGKDASPDSTWPEIGTPGEGRIGAIINIKNDTYPAFTIVMEITPELTESLFNQILSTIQLSQ